LARNGVSATANQDNRQRKQYKDLF